MLLVSDIYGATATLPVTINVRAANLPPIVQDFNPPRIVSTAASPDEATTYQVAAFDVDAGPEPISYTLLDDPDWISISTDGLLSFESSDNNVSSGDVTLVVSDGDTNVDQHLTFSVRVDNSATPGDGPIFLNRPPQTVLAGTNGIIYRPEMDPEEAMVTLQNPANGFTFANGDLRWNTWGSDGEAGTGDDLEPGVYYVELKATHGGADTYLTAPIVLGERTANEAPVFQVPGGNGIVALSAQTGARFEYTVLAIDPDGDRVSYELVNLAPSNAPVSIDQLGKITWESASGSVTFNVEATDRVRLRDVFTGHRNRREQHSWTITYCFRNKRVPQPTLDVLGWIIKTRNTSPTFG